MLHIMLVVRVFFIQYTDIAICSIVLFVGLNRNVLLTQDVFGFDLNSIRITDHLVELGRLIKLTVS